MSSGDEKQKLLERFKVDTRSILLSAPLGVLRRAFSKDYRSMIGSDPPLRQLGYSNMDEFARAHPDVLKSAIGPTGEVTYYVVATQETQHVASLVARQKKPSLSKLRKASIARPPPSAPRHSTMGAPYRRANRPIRRPLFRQPIIKSQSLPNSRFQQREGASSLTSKTPSSQSFPVHEKLSSGIPPFSTELHHVPLLTIPQLLASKNKFHDKIISVEGYPGYHEEITQYQDQFRVILFHNFSRGRKLEHPTVNVFFTRKHWNVSMYPNPLSLPSEGGVRVKLWAIVDYKFWKTRKEYVHSLKALYYRRFDMTSSGNLSMAPPLKVTVTRGTREIVHSQSTGGMRAFPNTRDKSPVANNRPSKPIAAPPSSLAKWLREELKDKPHGLWGRVLVKKYSEAFKEEPPDLLDIIKQLPFVGANCSIEDNPIIFIKKEVEQEKEEEEEEEEETEYPPLPSTVELPLSSEDDIHVLVVSIKSLLHFYVQHNSPSTTEALQRLEDSLCKYFNENKHAPPRKLNPERLYAFRWEDGTWCRTKLVSETGQTGLTSDGRVHVCYPDFGNDEQVEVNQLRELPKEFYTLPFQGVQCKLDGLSSETEAANDKFEEMAFEKLCTCLVKNKSDDHYTVQLSIDDTNINNVIEDMVYPINSLKPSLPPVGGASVSVILRDIGILMPGMIVVHIEGRGTLKLDELNGLINDHYGNDEKIDATPFKPEMGVVCCAKYSEDWYRVKVIDLKKDGTATVLFVDYGNYLDVEAKDLKSPLPHPLFELPSQALSAQLKDVPPPHRGWSNEATLWLNEYVDTRLTLQMVSVSECILFDDGVSLNEELLKHTEFFPPLYSITINDCPSVQLPDEPVLVIVPNCISPNEFTVQLCDSSDALSSLHESLQQYSITAPPVSRLQSGLVVSSLSSDEQWYRSLLLDTVSLRQEGDNLIEEVPVSHLDYGDEEMIKTSSDGIKQLSEEFLKLPSQGIAVSLHGVAPIEGTVWDSASAEKFKELVLDKYFFCQKKGVCPNGRSSVSLIEPTESQLVSTILETKKLAKIIL